ncbi:MAG: TlpA disulfide reductase family protein [Pirellulaceae bacterium]
MSDSETLSTRSWTRSSNFYVLVFGAIMLAGLLFLAWMGSPPRVTPIGQPMSTLDLQPLLHGADSIDAKDLLGKLTVFHFWGAWCPNSEKEFLEFLKLYQAYRDNSHIAFVSVSSSAGPELDLPKLENESAAFLDRFESTMPTYSDPAAMTRSRLGLMFHGGSFAYPTTVLVDGSGIIVDAVTGGEPSDLQRIAQSIERELSSGK